MEQFFFIAICLLLGLGSGFLGGLLGIGGGVVLVPALIVIYDLFDRFAGQNLLIVAVGTSLSCIGFTSAAAAWTQYRAGKIRFDIVRTLLPFFLLGSFAAGFIAPHLPTWLYQGFIGVFLALVGMVMFAAWQPDPRAGMPGLTGSACLGLGGGTVAGLAGIAGGNVIVPSLLLCNVPIHNATATSSAMGVPIALLGALGFALSSSSADQAHIDWWATPPIILAALFAAPLGVRFAHRVPAATLKRWFAVLLFVVAARILLL
ncbi:MAG: sulfite exporter TauE/SafE family protein [Pseudomonadota bacterium]